MVTATRPRSAGSIVLAERLAGIVRVFDPDVNAVIHPRRLDSAVASDAAALAADATASRKLVLEAGDGLPQAVQRALGAHPALAGDVAFWAGIIVDLSDAPLVGVRIARVDKAMCPRFHVDRVLLRAVITYVGRGTELLADASVDRSRLSPHHDGLPDELSGLMRPGCELWRASAGDVVIMKGELWLAGVGAIVHRSPPHEGPRLVLTLDPLE